MAMSPVKRPGSQSCGLSMVRNPRRLAWAKVRLSRSSLSSVPR